MTLDEARDLFAYTEWANARAFDAAESLTHDELTRTLPSSFPTVLATLGHIAGAEWAWLRRWHGESPGGMPPWASDTSLAAVRRELAATESARAAFLGSLTDADLSRPIEYRSFAGKTYVDPLANLVRHVTNHSTYHRGQVATMLRQLGKVPPSTDVIAYLRRSS